MSVCAWAAPNLADTLPYTFGHPLHLCVDVGLMYEWSRNRGAVKFGSHARAKPLLPCVRVHGVSALPWLGWGPQPTGTARPRSQECAHRAPMACADVAAMCRVSGVCRVRRSGLGPPQRPVPPRVILPWNALSCVCLGPSFDQPTHAFLWCVPCCGSICSPATTNQRNALLWCVCTATLEAVCPRPDKRNAHFYGVLRPLRPLYCEH